MRLETGWVPVALSTAIETGTSAAAVVEGFEIVVWRDASGNAHVWEDRCPHRGMRMSFGFVRGDHIACLYHGWQYDTAGQCRYIPAHPNLDVPQTIKVPAYRTEEKAGIVWATATDLPLNLPAGTEEATPLRSLYIDAPIEAARSALETSGFAFTGNAASTCVGGVAVFAALQAIGLQRSAAHLVALAPIDAETQKSLVKWAEGLRADAELAEVA